MIDLGLTPDQEAHAKALHDALIVIDMLTESSFPDNLFEDMAAGGLTCGSFTIGASGLKHMVNDTLPNHDEWWSKSATVEDIAIWHGIWEDSGNNVVPIRSAADIQSAKANGKVGIMLNVQNSICVGTDVDNVDFFHNLGLRVIQLTYNLQNFMGSGCLEDPKKNLSNFGIQAIERMNEIGMVVDTGHTGDGSIKHAAEVSSKPISCSHAGLAALSKAENPRVVSDSALKCIADGGGVFGLSAIPGMLTGDIRCTINDYIDHMEHAINVMGIDGVGIGTDAVSGVTLELIATAPDWKGQQVPNSPEVWPVCTGHDGLEDHSGLPNVTRALVARGYADDDIRKLMGGNWLRLLGDTIG
ncbi:MAG: dipeptidase [Woeseiaceae bacterium]